MASISFFEFTFDTTSFVLTKNNQPVALRPKSAALLNLFLQQPNQLINKREIQAELWPNVLVQDHVLFQVVSEIRKIAPEHELIRTQPNAGYLWIAPTIPGKAGKDKVHFFQAASIGLLCLGLVIVVMTSTTPEPIKALPAMNAYNKGVIALSEGNTELALSMFAFSLSQNPQSFESSLMLAESFFLAEKPELALGQLSKLTKEQNLSEYHKLEISNLLSRIYQSQGQIDLAIDTILEGIESQELIAQCTITSLESQLQAFELQVTGGQERALTDILSALGSNKTDKTDLYNVSLETDEPGVNCADLISSERPIEQTDCALPAGWYAGRTQEKLTFLKEGHINT